PVLAALHLLCGLLALGVRSHGRHPAKATSSDDKPGLSLLWRSSYLRDLGLLVSVGAIGAALLDYVFKAQATAAYAKAAPLLRFFAIFYTTTSLATFVIQTTITRRLLERLGLSRTVSSLPVTLGVGGLTALVAPSLMVVSIMRGAEATVRSSLF